jgi:hypothetical protein
MMLKRIIHGAGNAIRYEIDYSDWLEDGTSLTAGTVTIGIVDVTIGTVTLTPSHRLVFLLSGGSLNETFILDVQATDSRGEIKNDTLSFSIQAP